MNEPGAPGAASHATHVPDRQPRRRRAPTRGLAAVVMASMFGTGFTAVLLLDGDDETDAASIGSAAMTTDQGDTERTDRSEVGSTTIELPDSSGLPTGDDADRMSIQIEPSVDSDAAAGWSAGSGATATIRTDGRLYFEGAFRSENEAQRYVTRASEVFGPDAIVKEYQIDPAAPAPEAGDVALDKPVLFESGSTDIHPDYIPFLEACGDVLKLNPQITMSISAFTDSSGPDDFNLELSQRRAQAIVDFYRSIDVADEQLVGTGFGEDAPVADNTSEAGRSENRRAMLQLLDLMAEG